MLVIDNLHVSLEEKKETNKIILRGLNLAIPRGKVHAIMGPNGSGKSTLANTLAGKENYKVTAGSIKLSGENILSLTPEMRAVRGLFVAFQYPAEIPGVNNMYFIRTALNKIREQKGLPLLDAADFLIEVKNKIKEVGLQENFLQRAVNDGFSGGEKKRNEILQMLMLSPSCVILDETDSGLDIDALQTIGHCVENAKNQDRCFLVITHYPRLLDYIKPDVVHVMVNGTITKSGDKSLAYELEKKGYGWLEGKSHDS